MDSRNSILSMSPIKCCNCGCNCSTINRSFSGSYIPTKRKHVELEEESPFTIAGFDIPKNARVEVENECTELRETISSQQLTINDLISELDEERNASASAADEAMSMILRLQSERAEIEMEARQFKRFVEEKMEHDQQEMLELDELLYKREQMIESLTFELQAYKHKLMSYGLTESEVDEINVIDAGNGMNQNTGMVENLDGELELPGCKIYPSLKCNTNGFQVFPDCDEKADIENYALGEPPISPDQLKDLEFRIDQLEKTPSTIQPDGGEFISAKNVIEKVVVGQSPRPGSAEKFSTDNSKVLSGIGKDIGHNYATESPRSGVIKKMGNSHLDVNSNLTNVDYAPEFEDDVSDRVYTIDSVHQGASPNGVKDQKASVGIGVDDHVIPGESLNQSVRDLEIKNLFSRLRALEADRETMRQAVISIGTDKAQLVLLREIAQNLCKVMSSSKAMTVQKPAKRFWFVQIFKWVLSIILWRRKASRCKFQFGMSAHNAGLLMLLDKSSRVGPRRFVSSTNMRP